MKQNYRIWRWPVSYTHLAGIYAHSVDSIWVFDDSERISLISQKGNIIKRINCHDYIQEHEEIIIHTNHAISTTHLGYNLKHQSLLFAVKDKSTSPISFKVKEVFLNETGKTITFDLSPSVVEPDISQGYANMNEPNVNFNGEEILYNYPIESHIYTLNTLTGERTTIDASKMCIRDRSSMMFTYFSINQQFQLFYYPIAGNGTNVGNILFNPTAEEDYLIQMQKRCV